MNETLFAERMAALRAKQAASNLSPLSECREPHKLATFLLIYAKSIPECSASYMEGAKYLLGYLTYGRLTALDLDIASYPLIEDTSYAPNRLLVTYEMQELAVLISGESYGSEVAKVKRAIYLTTLDLINKGLI